MTLWGPFSTSRMVCPKLVASRATEYSHGRTPGKRPKTRMSGSQNGRPPFSSINDEQAEKLFQAAFSGRGVDEMLDVELARFNIKPGVNLRLAWDSVWS